jgi:hypothetical protein
MRVPTRRSFQRAAIAALALGTLATTAAPSAGAGPRDRVEEARQRSAFPVAVASDFDFAGVPKKVKPGTYDFTFVNTSREEVHELVMFKVPKNTTRADVVAAADNEDEDFFSDFRGASFAEPLDVQRPEEIEPGFFAGRADMSDPGRYVYLCFVSQSDTGQPHYQLGMLDFVDVK